jgi:hypothetical protein
VGYSFAITVASRRSFSHFNMILTYFDYYTTKDFLFFFMAKKFAAVVKLSKKAGQANPSPPVGPTLAQHGLNIMELR